MRHSQNKYRSPGFRRKVGRILFLCGLGTAILLSFLVLGKLLHDRLEKAAPLLKLPAVTYADTAAKKTFAEPLPLADHRPGTGADGIFCTVDEAVFRNGDSSALKEACSVAAELYDGLSIPVSGEDALRFSEGIPEEWKNLLDAAHTYGLTVCAVWPLPDEIPGIDSATCAAARTLAKEGADEILFIGLTSASLGPDDPKNMAALCEDIRGTGSGTKIGFALMPEVFADADSAPRLDSLASHADFLAVDIGEPPAGDPDGIAHAEAAVEALYGSISYYPLRIMLRGNEGKLTAQSAALREAGYTAIQPLS